jgi:hypothetical protein
MLLPNLLLCHDRMQRNRIFYCRTLPKVGAFFEA